jgi:hypothetical protein
VKSDGASDAESASEAYPAGKLGYKVLASIGAALSTAIARKALSSGWKKATGKEPPADPSHPDVRWREAIGWAAASAGGLAVAKLIAQRRVAETWRRASGTLPPGMKTEPPGMGRPSE